MPLSEAPSSLPVPRWQSKVLTCPQLQAPPGMPLHSCGAGVAARGSVCPGPCWLLSKSQLQALSQQPAQPCRSQQTPITRKVVAGGEEEALLPVQGEGGGGRCLSGGSRAESCVGS